MINVFLWRAWQVASAAFLIFSMFCAGAIILRLAGIVGIRRAPSDDNGGDFFSDGAVEDGIFSLAAGYGALASLFFLAGVAGIYRTWFAAAATLTPVAAATALFGAPSIIGKFTNIFFVAKRRLPSISPAFLWTTTAFFFILCAFALSLLPPHHYDSLVYHLALPAEYIKNNSISPAPYNLYSHFPQNAEMIFLAALLLADGVAAQLITFFLGVALVRSVYFFTKKYTRASGKNYLMSPPDSSRPTDLPSASAAAASALLASSPFFLLLASSTYVEIHQAFIAFAAFWAFVKFLETDDGKYLIFSGALSGVAVGVKYTGFAAVAAVNVILVLRFLRGTFAGASKSIKVALGEIAVFTLAAIIAASPWLIKNIIYTGNPVFPFFYKVFGYALTGWTSAAADGYFAALTEYAHKSSVFFELAMLPYNLVFNPVRYGGGIDVLGDFGWPALLVAAIVACIFLRRKLKFASKAALYSATVFAVWFLTKPVLRFLVPLSGVLAVLGGVAAGFFLTRKSFVVRAMAGLSLAAALAANANYFFFIAGFFKPREFLLGRQNLVGYLASTQKNSPHRAFEYLNNALPSGSRVLFVGEQRAYYCLVPLVAPGVFAPNPLVAWADTAASPTELLETLRLKNFTHIFYNVLEGERLKPYGIFGFSEVGARNWEGLLKILLRRAVYYDGTCVIYDIR